MPLSLEQLLHRHGGVAARAELIELTSRAAVDAALREERIVRVARGMYALPMADQARRAAAALHGVASHRSAAAAHGWELKTVPRRPSITVDTDRTIAAARRAEVELHWSRLEETDLEDGWVTSRERTFVDCSRHLPFDEALAVADSALRHRHLTPERLRELAAGLRGPGSAQARRIAHEATGAAANPFESALRAIALDVPGLRLRPQVLVVEEPFSIRPDLSDEALRIALEADSFTWHGSRDALKRDCRRYNLLVLAGWRVLRFTWEDVMLTPDQVRATLEAAVAVVHRPEERPLQRTTPA